MSDFGTKRNTSGAIFFSVRKSTDDKGRPCAVLAAKAQKGDPGAKPVYKKDGSQAVDKDGNDLWQTEHDYLTGRIIALEDKAVTMAGKDRHFLNVTVMGKTTKMVLSLERGDNYWVDFLKRLLNVDLQKPVEFQPYSIADKEKPGKVNRLMMLRQDGVNIPSMWNKANNYGHDENGEGGIPSGEQFENPKTGEMVAAIQTEAARLFPALFPYGYQPAARADVQPPINAGGCIRNDFAYKLIDGDGYDANGKAHSGKEGWKGCWILKISTYAGAMRIVNGLNNNAPITEVGNEFGVRRFRQVDEAIDLFPKQVGVRVPQLGFPTPQLQIIFRPVL